MLSNVLEGLQHLFLFIPATHKLEANRRVLVRLWRIFGELVTLGKQACQQSWALTELVVVSIILIPRLIRSIF